MKTMLASRVYMACFEHDGHNIMSNPSLTLPSILLIFLHQSLFVFLTMSDATHLSAQKQNLASKLKDTNNAAKPEVQMHQHNARSQSVAPSDHASPPHSHENTPQSSSNIGNSQEPGTQTVLGELLFY